MGGGGGQAGTETKTVCQTVSNEVNTKMRYKSINKNGERPTLICNNFHDEQA